MELERQSLGVQEDTLAQVEQDRLADACRQHGVPRHQGRPDDAADEVGGNGERERHPVTIDEGRQAAINTERDQCRPCNLRRRADDHHGHGQDDTSSQRAHQRAEQPQRALPDLPALCRAEVAALFAFNSGDTHEPTSSRSRCSSSSRLEITKR